MSRIHNKNTGPERRVRSCLHGLGYRFRLHDSALPGTPDIVLPRYRTTIFVHGCFWHRHPRCKYAYTPKSRVAFWQAKFAENVERDKAVGRLIRLSGWRRVVIWECQTPDAVKLRCRLRDLLRSS